MIYRNVKHTLLLMMLALFALVSCIDDDLDLCEDNVGEIPEYIKEGYSLNVVVTLDKMGGDLSTRAENEETRENPMEYWENYIDPEKFRVLVFNDKDQLLFESKSRWVKQFDAENRWLVSVPVFTYGDDLYEHEDIKEWPWEEIRDALTKSSFKIAILANRPEMEWYPGKLKSTDPDAEGWIDNTGPHWTPSDYLKKDVFDLHHCQYDPIYHGKSSSAGYYDFIMGNWWEDEKKTPTWSTDTVKANGGIKPEMGATSSWVEWGTITDSHGWGKRHTILPSQTHPIPMYGIQRFDHIDPKVWQKGTPFNLSTDIPGDNLNGEYEKRSISLLRSVVKLELLIPVNGVSKKPGFVGLCYSNIYARCEPLNVWDPTDEVWKRQHNGKLNLDKNVPCADMSSLLRYGPIAKSFTGNAKTAYQNRISWLYGIWYKYKKWGEKQIVKVPVVPEGANTPYPEIMNSCIQRNTVIICDDNGDLSYNYPSPNNNKTNHSYRYSNDGYYHYVAYVGERNLNDPSDLGNMGDPGGGKPTVIYWIFNIGTTKYGLPITNYDNPNNPIYSHTYTDTFVENTTDPKAVESVSAINSPYMKDIMVLENEDGRNTDNLPWPLIRNHVYRLTLDKKPTRSTGDAEGFIIKSEDLHSKSLKVD